MDLASTLQALYMPHLNVTAPQTPTACTILTLRIVTSLPFSSIAYHLNVPPWIIQFIHPRSLKLIMCAEYFNLYVSLSLSFSQLIGEGLGCLAHSFLGFADWNTDPGAFPRPCAPWISWHLFHFFFFFLPALCRMWDADLAVPHPGIEPRPPVLGA